LHFHARAGLVDLKMANAAIRIRRPLPHVLLVEFATQYGLASTFLRFQEYYESPRFRGQVFALEEYMDWYAETHGSFSYFDDWAGFNVPSLVFEPFRNGDFDPLLVKERRLLALLAREREPFYVIGVARDGGKRRRETVMHELAHALYYTNAEYRREVVACLRGQDTRALARKLRGQGYHARVIQDEVHAYLLDASLRGARQFVELRRRLRAIFRAHGGERALARIL
jgi:hypothetical protein